MLRMSIASLLILVGCTDSESLDAATLGTDLSASVHEERLTLRCVFTKSEVISVEGNAYRSLTPEADEDAFEITSPAKDQFKVFGDIFTRQGLTTFASPKGSAELIIGKDFSESFLLQIIERNPGAAGIYTISVSRVPTGKRLITMFTTVNYEESKSDISILTTGVC